MSSPSVKGVEYVSVVAGDIQGAVVVEDSENVVEGASDARAFVTSSWQFTNSARDPFFVI